MLKDMQGHGVAEHGEPAGIDRIQEGRLDINKTKEVVDIIGSVLKLIPNAENPARLKTPEEILLFSWTGACSSRYW